MFRKSFKIFSAAILALGLFSAPLVSAYTKPGEVSGFVNDFAKVFSAQQKQALETKLQNFEQQTTNEIAVVTINDLDGDYIENYAVKLFEDYKIGKKGKDNGILLLIAVQDRKMRIEVGYGLEGVVTDVSANNIIQQVLAPAFKQNDYYGGVDKATDILISSISGDASALQNLSAESSSAGGVSESYIFNLIYVVFFLFMFLTSILSRSKSWWAGGVVGGVAGVIIGLIEGFLYFGIIAIVLLIPLGLWFDYVVSQKFKQGKVTGVYPWWIGGGKGGSGSGGGGFGGFGGGGSGGGGSSGSW